MSFLYLLTAVAVLYAMWKVWRYHRARIIAERLRANPPERALIEVTLPRGITDSRQRMQSLYRKLVTLTQTDDAMRREGLGVIETVMLVEAHPGRSAPEMRFLIYCAPEQTAQVKRMIKQAYSGQAQVVEPREDPLADVAEELRPRREDEIPAVDEAGEGEEGAPPERDGDHAGDGS